MSASSASSSTTNVPLRLSLSHISLLFHIRDPLLQYHPSAFLFIWRIFHSYCATPLFYSISAAYCPNTSLPPLCISLYRPPLPLLICYSLLSFSTSVSSTITVPLPYVSLPLPPPPQYCATPPLSFPTSASSCLISLSYFSSTIPSAFLCIWLLSHNDCATPSITVHTSTPTFTFN